MKKDRFNITGCVYFSLLLLILIFSSNSDISLSYQYAVHAGISDTLKEIKDLFSGIHNFISHIISISSFIGFNTFILFLFILIFSSGLSAIGVPKGRASFIISLLLADAFWLLWERSFNPASYDYLFKILRSNLIILVPVIVFALINWQFPRLWRTLRRKVRSLFSRGRPGMSRAESVEYTEEFSRESQNFQKSLYRDIINSRENKEIQLSQDTLGFSNTLKDLLARIKK